jgi:shikimate dehydrogenase
VPGQPLGMRLIASEPTSKQEVTRAAVLGRPIAHSLSPALHNAAYQALGLRWRYAAIDCGVTELPAVLAAAGPDWAGFSCTMPLKRAALDLAAAAGERASQAGAANTLLPMGSGSWRADNTDVAGILGALAEREVSPSSVALLGAGGTASAGLVALRELGMASCLVLVRDPARTGQLRATAERADVRIDVRRLDAVDVLRSVDLIISTLPAGAADPLARAPWPRGVTLLDVVYQPWPTALAEGICRSGGLAIGGHVMLLHQAAEQVRLMTNRPAPVEAMRTALSLSTHLP